MVYFAVKACMPIAGTVVILGEHNFFLSQLNHQSRGHWMGTEPVPAKDTWLD